MLKRSVWRTVLEMEDVFREYRVSMFSEYREDALGAEAGYITALFLKPS
jgi:hypothetical protein